MIDVNLFWTQVSPRTNKTPRHRGGDQTAGKIPLPKPKKIRVNKPGLYWCERGNSFFIVYPDYSVDVMFLNGDLSDSFLAAGMANGFTRNSEYDHYLGPL